MSMDNECQNDNIYKLLAKHIRRAKAGIYGIKNLLQVGANARVKLHSQVNFESKKILGPKKFWVQTILDPKTLSQKRNLSSENFASKEF